VGQARSLAGSADIDARQNRIWCDFFHRGIEPQPDEEGRCHSQVALSRVAKPSTSLMRALNIGRCPVAGLR
jgi:hypothetical protein